MSVSSLTDPRREQDDAHERIWRHRSDVTAIPRTGNSWTMERVTAESSVDDLRRQRERVEKWPSGPTRERVLEALDEWIAQKTLSPHALFSQRLTAGRL